MPDENKLRYKSEFTDRRFGDAAYAYCEGRFENAATLFQQLAESENSMAAAYLAEMYLRGEGVPLDIEKGIQWLEHAVAWGNSNAAFNLGVMYRTGHHGIPLDDHKSKHFFRLAKDLGCKLSVDQYLVDS